jgi:hypothetical protein
LVPCYEHFIAGTYQEYSSKPKREGIAGGLEIKGRGIVRYELLLDRNGNVKAIEREALHIRDYQ